MAERKPASQASSPPETFVKQVKEALENLYDFPYLQRHPLVLANDDSTESGARDLRRDLIAAIETLNPGTDVSAHTPQARIYNLLVLHYVEGRTVQEAAHEIGISQRQAHRNLRQGEESVAAVLWARRPAGRSLQPKATQLSSVREEMARLVTQPRPVDLGSLLQRARAAVKQQATQRNIVLEIESLSKPLIISTDPAVAQQVFINALSHTLRQAQPGVLRLTLKASRRLVALTWQYRPEPAAVDTPAIGEVIVQLADRLGWSVKQEEHADDGRTITLQITGHCPTILVIDDNEGLVKLLDSYLTGRACQVVSATNGAEGLRLAHELVPDAIVLDVMIPGMDGWEVLQRLRNGPQSAEIPVIMCSVLDSPELAYSLGASLFLPKPVSRDDVLSALSQLGVV